MNEQIRNAPLGKWYTSPVVIELSMRCRQLVSTIGVRVVVGGGTAVVLVVATVVGNVQTSGSSSEQSPQSHSPSHKCEM